jgi:hypothetical protein
MVLRKIFILNRDEITCWRMLHNELHGAYSSPNTIKFMKSRNMRWAGQECMQGFGMKPRKRQARGLRDR